MRGESSHFSQLLWASEEGRCHQNCFCNLPFKCPEVCPLSFCVLPLYFMFILHKLIHLLWFQPNIYTSNSQALCSPSSNPLSWYLYPMNDITREFTSPNGSFSQTSLFPVASTLTSGTNTTSSQPNTCLLSFFLPFPLPSGSPNL